MFTYLVLIIIINISKSSYCYDDSDAMSDADSDYDTTYSNPKNADVHMAPRNYYDSDEDMYFDDL